ncbi:hypothetical protein HYFRA_00001210 [Hymenoscyphus fraxineus]|uniref:Uncharacterized protein n=1 Tax=Hymenoscyphus fraxineus TaxID=746836 RepID=A0A9N9PRH3_9HELO|nr:hypothetical protein HYFRA_00001210 [Hymenoscyphus fraxineus]
MAHYPNFSCFGMHVVEKNDEGSGETVVSTKDQIMAGKPVNGILAAVKRAFATQMIMGDDDLITARGINIGFDSLISARISSWFLSKIRSQ